MKKYIALFSKPGLEDPVGCATFEAKRLDEALALASAYRRQKPNLASAGVRLVEEGCHGK